MTRNQKIKKLLAEARSCLGMPYLYGAYLAKDKKEKPDGFDCSSFTQYVFSHVGVALPRSTILQAANGTEIPLEEIEVGDVIFFEGNRGHYRHDLFPGRKIYIGHAGIYTGDDMIIHATNNSSASGVVMQLLHNLTAIGYEVAIIKRFITSTGSPQV